MVVSRLESIRRVILWTRNLRLLAGVCPEILGKLYISAFCSSGLHITVINGCLLQIITFHSFLLQIITGWLLRLQIILCSYSG